MDGKANNKRQHVIIAICIFLISLAIRLYPALSAENLSPDAIEYINQARHTAKGEIGITSIKRHYFDHYPVVYSGIDDRPPLFPFLAAILFSMNASVAAVQVFNALLASLASAVWYAAFCYLVSPTTAVAGSLAVTFSLWFWGTSSLALSEPLSLLIMGFASWTVASGAWKRYRGIVGLAVLTVLAYLTRHAGIILLPSIVALFLIEYFREDPLQTFPTFLNLMKRCLLVIGITLMLYMPVAVYSNKHFGQPFYDPNTATFLWGENAVNRYTTAPPESISALVKQQGLSNYLNILTFNGRRYAVDIFIRPGGLGFAVFGLPLLLFYLRREKIPSGTWFLLILATTNIILHALTYGHYDPRYVLLTVIPLLPLCFHAIEQWPGLAGKIISIRAMKLKATIVIIMLLTAGNLLQNAYGFNRIYQEFPKHIIQGKSIRVSKVLLPFTPAEYETLFSLIENLLADDEIIATGHPWLLNFFSGRPTALLPIDLDEQSLPAFLKTFSIRLIVLERASLGENGLSRYTDLIIRQAQQGKGMMTTSGPFILYLAEDDPSNS